MIAVGGMDTAMVQVAAQNATNLDMFKGLAGTSSPSSRLMAWGLGWRFWPAHILARFMAADSPPIPAPVASQLTWMMLCLGGAVAIRFLGASWPASPALPTSSGGWRDRQPGARVHRRASKILFNPGLPASCSRRILAAVMSTLSCQLLVCSSAITEDLYKPFLRKDASRKSWCGSAAPAHGAADRPGGHRRRTNLAQNRVLGLVSYAWALASVPPSAPSGAARLRARCRPGFAHDLKVAGKEKTAPCPWAMLVGACTTVIIWGSSSAGWVCTKSSWLCLVRQEASQAAISPSTQAC